VINNLLSLVTGEAMGEKPLCFRLRTICLCEHTNRVNQLFPGCWVLCRYQPMQRTEFTEEFISTARHIQSLLDVFTGNISVVPPPSATLLGMPPAKLRMREPSGPERDVGNAFVRPGILEWVQLFAKILQCSRDRFAGMYFKARLLRQSSPRCYRA
jgi:hypothetical protein